MSATMKNTITITHRATKDSVSTTVETPWSPAITKTWRREGGSYKGTFKKWWDEEDALPPAVQRAADASVTQLCAELDL